MSRLYNIFNYKNLRRNLRKNQTDAEKKIWSKLRKKQIQDLKFYRQFGIGKYIVDFYCPEKKLTIEIDGSQHTENIDKEKTDYLKQNGILILRFWNNEVFENLEGIMDKIIDAINRSNSSQPPLAKRRS